MQRCLQPKEARNHDIATMRIKWVEELRGVLSQYHSMLMTHEKFEDADRRLMSETWDEARSDDELQ